MYTDDVHDDLDSITTTVFWWSMLCLGAAIFLLCL